MTTSPAARIAQLEADLAAAEAKLAAVEALADADEKARSLCASDPDCPCAYKDCYECGKWHACTHTPYVAIRAALATQPAREVRHDRQCAAGITNGAARCQCATPPQPAP